jgi:FkbM family methyltransferase
MKINEKRTAVPPYILEGYNVSEISVEIPDIPCDIRLRLKDSDAQVFKQVFVDQQYAVEYPSDVKIIIDAGANVGYATLWYSQKYPEARIIAIEPDPVTFRRLSQQCAELANVELLNAALWHEDGWISLKRTNEAGAPVKSWGTRTTEARGETRAVSVPSFLREFGIGRIDIFKIDIEGAELEVFSKGDLTWINQTRCFAVETHERFKAGSHAAVMDALRHDFDVSRRGENVFFKVKA